MAELTLGSVGLAAQLFVSVYHTYKFVATARGLADDAPVIYWKLRIEQLRFQEWGRYWGIASGSLDERLDFAGIQDAACGVLIEMARLMENVKKLTNKYGMEKLASVEGTGDEELDHEEGQEEKMPKKGPSMLKQFRYAFKDKPKFASLIEDLNAFNDGLFNLLRVSEYQAISIRTQSAALRNAEGVQTLEALGEASARETNTSTAQRRSKPIYKEIHQSAMYKLITQRQQQEPEAPSGTLKAEVQIERWKRPISSLSEYLRSTSASHVLAKYTAVESASDPTTVLVEWKTFQPSSPEHRSIRARVDKLTALLASAEKPPEVRVPDCLGFVEDDALARFGYLFKLPQNAVTIAPTTLHTTLSRGTSGLLPSLGDRFELARALANAVIRLHDCGWVHGGLSSGNVVFFHHEEVPIEKPSLQHSSVHSDVRIDIKAPYLLGFTYGRPTDVAEPTLEWTSNAVPSAENLQSLYRHPSLIISNPAHPSFQSPNIDHLIRRSRRQRYDMFSLGLLLLEIGLWESLDTLWKPKYAATPTGFIEKLQRVYLPRLRHRMGDNYFWVTATLFGDWEGSDALVRAGGDEDTDWAAVVSVLMHCQA